MSALRRYGYHIVLDRTIQQSGRASGRAGDLETPLFLSHRVFSVQSSKFRGEIFRTLAVEACVDDGDYFRIDSSMKSVAIVQPLSRHPTVQTAADSEDTSRHDTVHHDVSAR